jgi:hypothetical protein
MRVLAQQVTDGREVIDAAEAQAAQMDNVGSLSRKGLGGGAVVAPGLVIRAKVLCRIVEDRFGVSYTENGMR